MEDTKKFDQGAKHFDEGEYFEAHELWEELWTEAVGARHAFLQGLIQTAVALHHARNRNYGGTRKLLSSALTYLEKGRSEATEVDVDRHIDSILEFELALQKALAGGTIELPYFKLARTGE